MTAATATKSTATRKPAAKRTRKPATPKTPAQPVQVTEVPAPTAKPRAKRLSPEERGKRSKFTYRLGNDLTVFATGSREDDGKRYWYEFTADGKTFTGEWTAKTGFVIEGQQFGPKVRLRTALGQYIG